MNNKKRGFTILELMTVIAVIGLISAIVVTYVQDARQRAGISAGLTFSQHNEKALFDSAFGMWNFDEESGTVVKDEMGYRNGTLISPYPTYSNDTPTNNGKSLTYSTAGGYVTVQKMELFTTAYPDFTIMAWAKATGGSSYNRHVFYQHGGMTGYCDASSSIKNCIRIRLNNNGDYFEVSTKTSSSVSLGRLPYYDQWFHLAVVKEGQKVSLYINGKITGQRTDTNSSISWGAGALGLIGRGNINNPNETWVGNIDSFRVYGKGLTTAQIEQYFAETAPKYILADASSSFKKSSLIKGLFGGIANTF